MGVHFLWDWKVTLDIPGPYKLEWSSQTARERGRKTLQNPIPVATGLAFAGAPYVAGAAIVYFGPAPLKPVGASMLVPGPSDPILFAMGYQAGKEIEDDLYAAVPELISEVREGFPQVRRPPYHYM